MSVTSKDGTTIGFRPLGHGPWVVILHAARASQHEVKFGCRRKSSSALRYPADTQPLKDRVHRGTSRGDHIMTTTARGPHTDSGQPTSDSGILRALEGAQPCDGVTHRPTSRSAGNGKATVTLTTPAADTAVTGGGRPAEHRDRPQGVEVRIHGIGDYSTFSALGRPKYKELVDSRVWIGQVADEFTVTSRIDAGRGTSRRCWPH